MDNVEVFKLPILLEEKQQIVLRAYNDAKALKQSNLPNANAVITKNEFWDFLKFVRFYTEYMYVYKKLDTKKKDAVTLEMFVEGKRVFEWYKMDVSNPEKIWQGLNKKNEESINYNQFVNWGMKNLGGD